MPDLVGAVQHWFAHLSVFKKSLLGFATTVMLVELAFRRFAPTSVAYTRWTKGFEAIGKVWTAVILSVVYIVSVGLVGGSSACWARTPSTASSTPSRASGGATSPTRWVRRPR